ncbi:LON peptidase substrate-binding domain-containing protein [Echinicola jeungdonensis]|uniref:LON peptidase substrate-binding domain-containing protein n=1 Tax=Echinicola jeungdonensis TaxID=709343 RepID=A0ABV5J3H1_9BACT|nr:LON peptidase substrate-binding domain-containing protein [Echinicola jeungdonensis]MDN3669627.1 LON peptidase substrate-binding domain-containing protein [Echinicola jeungdonensis]
MSVTLPLFPLKLVAFPGEKLNLHIFEPRYKQLIKDCIEQKINFGVCVYLDRLKSHGTEVELLEVHKTYEDGRMDVKTQGIRSFRILSFENPIEGKLYAGGEVNLLEVDNNVVSKVAYNEFLFYLKEMLKLLHYEVDLDTIAVNSFTFAHVLGLNLEEEYQLLAMENEMDRIRYLITHLKRVIPIVREVEKAREKVKMNGHFRHFDPLDF